MDVLKKTRTAQRVAFTKAYRKLEELSLQSDINISELETELDVFISKAERLEQTDIDILAVLSETEIEAEYETIEDYRDKAIRIRLKMKKMITDCTKGNAVSNINDETDNRQYESNGNVRNRKFKLPQLELCKFDGDIKEWLHFWSQFEKIHKDPGIVNSDKFQYLLQATVEGSRAREVIESFPPTGENYPKAIDCLKSRFGRDDLLVEVYVRELLKLVLRNATSHNFSNNLCALYDNLESQIRALETLGVTTEKSAALLYPLVESCMPEDFLRAWLRTPCVDHGGDPKIRLDSLLNFLKTEVESEERISLAMAGFDLKQEMPIKGKINNATQEKCYSASSLLSTSSNGDKLCIFCNGKHTSFKCFKAQKMTLNEKQKILKDKGCCFKCFKAGHRVEKCRYFIKCSKCNYNHNVIMCPKLIQDQSKETRPTLRKSESVIKEDQKSLNLASISNSQTVLLQTLQVYLVGKNCTLCVRALFDSGSQKSYIKKETAIKLGLIPSRQQMLSHSLFGGKRTDSEIHNVYKIELESMDGKFICNFDVFDENIICDTVPSAKNGPWKEELKSMKISINDFDSCTEPIAVLIGADVAGRLFTGKRKVLSCGLVAMETYLGWTLMGKTTLPAVKEDSVNTVISMFIKEATISDLFSLDVLGITDPIEKKSKMEKEFHTKQFFEKTVTVNEERRYEVALPWNEEHLQLPTNKDVALKRLETSTKKLRSENLFTVYDEVFKEWMSLGIIEDVPNDNVLDEHYLPHRPVVKQQGTTKVRPVFDASARSVGSPSLNQCLEAGPNLLELIPNLLLRFREYKYGIIADIEKAFLQISIRPEDRNYLRFFWWDVQKEIVKIMRHRRVVFGVKSSPFLLEAVLDLHLKKYLETPHYDKEIITKLIRSFYVDNLVTSLNDEKEILPFIKEARDVMAEGKFNLRGWQYTKDNDPEPFSPVLGLVWDRQRDELKINLNWLDNFKCECISKRIILSVTHKIFDPIGLLCPVLLKTKLMLQELWKDGISWDSEVNADTRKKFLDWFAELYLLKQISAKRCFSADSSYMKGISIHTFCDASRHSYASAVFVRFDCSEGATVHLLAAKSRVAPVKSISIPRLELLAATVGARLSASVLEGLEWKNVEQHFWTDSTTVLAWIQRKECWAVFVNNRVQEIRKLTDPALWKHVPGVHNPADLPSRGCTAKQLLISKWWEGPTWLLEPKESWPVVEQVIDESAISQEKRKSSSNLVCETTVCSVSQEKVCVCCNTSRDVNNAECRHHGAMWYYHYFSNYDKILRMMAWIRRFIFNCRNPKSSRKTGELTYQEVQNAEKKVVKLIQKEYFTCANEKKLKTLSTYTDDEGLLRLKTKITYRKDSMDFRSPLILPSDHQVVKRLIMTEHRKNSHAGSQMLLNILREHYWILNARKTVRSVISKCVICLRYARRNLTAPASSLPENRVKDASIFEVVGFDLTGPIYLKGGSKAWICIYTCAVYRAVHFELLSSLNTEVFLLSFRRFIARRGRPSVVYCDNGTNFVGASNCLKCVNWEEISRYSTTKKIQWYFNPPTAAWWGGFWERLIGVMKQILRKVLGKAILSYEEMTTVLCDTESIINSRPLTHVSDCESELIPLSPNCFLQDFRQTGVPDFDQVDESVLNKRLKYRQKLTTDIRKRFRSEYLGLLISKNDLKKHDIPVKLGDIVLIGNDNAKCIDWPLGLVIELLPGRDNVTRLVRLKTSKGLLLRPIQRIFRLEVSSDWFEERKKNRKAFHTCENKEVPCTKELNVTKQVLGEDKFKTRRGRAVKAPQRLNL